MMTSYEDGQGDRTPMRTPGTAAEPRNGKTVIRRRDDEAVHPLDPLGVRIWQLIDGRRNLREISRELTREYELDLATAELCAATFVATLMDRGLVSWRAAPASAGMQPA
jgi:hypothetical protein